MGGMLRVAFESLRAFKSAVQHHVRVGTVEPAVNLDLYVQKSRNLAREPFEAFLDAKFDFCLLFFTEIFPEFPEDDVFNHIPVLN